MRTPRTKSHHHSFLRPKRSQRTYGHALEGVYHHSWMLFLTQVPQYTIKPISLCLMTSKRRSSMIWTLRLSTLVSLRTAMKRSLTNYLRLMMRNKSRWRRAQSRSSTRTWLCKGMTNKSSLTLWFVKWPRSRTKTASIRSMQRVRSVRATFSWSLRSHSTSKTSSLRSNLGK